MQIGIGLGITNLRNRTAFNALMLFQNGEQGVAFEPDPNTCFTDNAGMTPAGVGDAVALMLDKSQGAGYRNGVFGGLGPELVADGTFDENVDGVNLLNATKSWESGVARATSTTDADAFSGGAAPFVATGGSFIEIKAETTAQNGVYSTRFYSSSDGDGGVGNFVAKLGVGVGVHRGIYKVPGTGQVQCNISFGTTSPSVGDWVEFDNISVRKLPGNHATQPTAAARPILARVPEGGRRNLLTRTEEFDDAVWVKLGGTIVTANQAVAPNGTMTAELVRDDGSTEEIRSSASVTPSTSYTDSIYIKNNDAALTRILWRIDTAGDKYDELVWSGGVPSLQGVSNITTIVDVGDGWYRVSLTNTAPPNATTQSLGVQPDRNGFGGVYLWGAQLEEGSTASAYQKVTNTYDVTEAGKADKWHLVFDGVDDVLDLGDVLQLGTSDKTLAITMVDDDGTSNGSIFSRRGSGPSGSVGAGWGFRSESGTISLEYDDGVSLDTSVMGSYNGLVSLAVQLAEIEHNVEARNFRNGSADGSAVDISALGDVTGTRPLGLGARPGDLFYLNGKVFGMVFVDRLLSASEKNNVNIHLAVKAGVTL